MKYASFLPAEKPITVDYITKKVYIDGKEAYECGKLATIFSLLPRSLIFLLPTVIVFVLIYLLTLVVLLSLFSITQLEAAILVFIVTLVAAKTILIAFRPTVKNIENISANIYVIPEFDNYLLEYELFGDYSKLISKIEIVENHKPHSYATYRAAFYFKNIPLSGMMKLKYL